MKRSLLSSILPLVAAAAAITIASCGQWPGPGGFESSARAAPPGLAAVGRTAAMEGEGDLLADSQADELLVVERTARAGARSDDDPGSGALVAKIAERDVPMPLEHTDVRARILGHLAAVDVTQRFHNPFDGKIEAVYVFPLPHDAGVRDFVMTIGERRIRGVIREREEAEQIYHEARARGHVASLLREERPNVFTQKVANIVPGKRVDVAIRYLHVLAYRDGCFEWTFPMVVGPRFNPPRLRGDVLEVGGAGGTGIGAVARGAGGTSGQAVEVEYLAPGERSGHDVALRVDVDAGAPLVNIECASHQIQTERSETGARVTLAAGDRVPNRDFVLRFAVDGERTQPALFAHHDGESGWFSLLLHPPGRAADLPRQPIELVLVLDCSGSMRGEPIAQARAAVHQALDLLGPRDGFQVVRFSDDASGFGRALVPATADNVARAHRYVDDLRSEGGTMMERGIAAALGFPRDERRVRIVALLTDGFIGNDTEILAMVAERIGDARLFAFGVGAAPNRYLLEGLARIGSGVAGYLASGVDGARVMQRFVQRATRPALCAIELVADGGDVVDVQPQRIPDLYAGAPVAVAGRYRGAGPPRLRLRGMLGGERIELPVGDAAAGDAADLPALWARAKVESLRDAALRGESTDDQVRALALEFNLVSPFTSFVALDATTVTAGAVGTTVPVAVPVPAGVKYETTVSGR